MTDHELAARLEKAIEALPKELMFFRPSAMRMLELAAFCRAHSSEILAALRASDTSTREGETRKAIFAEQSYGAIVATIFESDDVLVEVHKRKHTAELIVHNRRGETDRWDDCTADLKPEYFEMLGSVADAIRTPPPPPLRRAVGEGESVSRCKCRQGRDHDGSEFGPCEYCEQQTDAERALAVIRRDAARWRISQIKYPRLMDDTQGYFAIEDSEFGTFSVGIQPHLFTKSTSINTCILGRGPTESIAIDEMFEGLKSGALPPEIESICNLFWGDPDRAPSQFPEIRDRAQKDGGTGK